MTQVHATRQRTDAPRDFDHYRLKARDLRAEALVGFYGATRSVVFNAVRAPFHRAR
ncbi:hypothetical protein [Bauldia litoralis]|uniref:hypothetical protein n=1 Tax=Bauldia litoralis TaxID=665467 RepID=UPI0032664923